MGHIEKASKSSGHDSLDYRALHMPNLKSFQIADGWQWDQSDSPWRGQTHSIITYYTNNDNNSILFHMCIGLIGIHVLPGLTLS